MGAPQPRPWHDEAKRLFDLGVPVTRIAAKVGVSYKTAYFHLHPTGRDAARARHASVRCERRRTDPAYAERVRATNKRSRIRAAARQEAAETGEPVEQVYERWGVA